MRFEPRRRFLKTAGAIALAFGHPGVLRAAAGPPIADAHSHIGMFSRSLSGRSLKAEMEASGVTLLAWSIVGDGRWISATNYGIQQRSTPASGEQAGYFREKLNAMRAHLATIGLGHVQ